MTQLLQQINRWLLQIYVSRSNVREDKHEERHAWGYVHTHDGTACHQPGLHTADSCKRASLSASPLAFACGFEIKDVEGSWSSVQIYRPQYLACILQWPADGNTAALALDCSPLSPGTSTSNLPTTYNQLEAPTW